MFFFQLCDLLHSTCPARVLTTWDQHRAAARDSNLKLKFSVRLTMLAAATSFFGRTNISQNYVIGSQSSSASGSRSGTPTPGSFGSSALPTVSVASPFSVGPWKVQPAAHKTTNKRVSVWSFDKRNQEMEKMSPLGKERTLDVLKAEVSIFLYIIPL
jgi:hypothetical protein